MITIDMKNVKTKINNINQIPFTALDEICETLSYKLSGFGVDTRRHYLINPSTGITYTGLVPRIIPILKKYGIAYKLNDMRVKPEHNFDLEIVNGFIPRNYQQNAFDNISSRAIFQGATGCGKTFIMALLMKKFGVKPIVVISPKASLAYQLKKEFEGFFGIEVGIVGGTDCIIKDITVGTPQSLKNQKTVLQNAKALFIDEAHFEPANTIFKDCLLANNAYYRVAVSATPWRESGDDLLLDAMFSKRNPKASITASMLIRAKVLVPCTINWVKADSGCDWLGDYATTYSKAIIDNDIRNKKIVDLTIKNVNSGRPTLLLIGKIRHGNKLLNMLLKHYGDDTTKFEFKNISYDMHIAEFISGSDDLIRREAVFEAVRKGVVKILIGSTIADEGLDIKNLSCLILAGGGKSSTRAFQRIGRVLRTCANKNDAVVYDFFDSCSTFNYHSHIRQALYSTEPEWKQVNYNG